MKLVRFNREMRPFGVSDTRAVPDDVADRLVANGDAVIEPSVFDAAKTTSPPMRTWKGRKGSLL